MERLDARERNRREGLLDNQRSNAVKLKKYFYRQAQRAEALDNERVVQLYAAVVARKDKPPDSETDDALLAAAVAAHLWAARAQAAGKEGAMALHTQTMVMLVGREALKPWRCCEQTC